MSMSNFIEWAVVVTSVMAATNPSPRESVSADEPVESGTGMSHLTVVPTNFDSDQRTAGRSDT